MINSKGSGKKAERWRQQPGVFLEVQKRLESEWPLLQATFKKNNTPYDFIYLIPLEIIQVIKIYIQHFLK
jgi:hypothetical protein